MTRAPPLVAVLVALAGCGEADAHCHTSSLAAATVAACTGQCSSRGMAGDVCAEAETGAPVCVCRDASSDRTCEFPRSECVDG